MTTTTPSHHICDVFGVLVTPGFESAAPRLEELLEMRRERIRPAYERWEPAFDLGLLSAAEFWARVLTDLGATASWQRLDEAVVSSYRVIPEGLALIDALRRQAPVHLLSNTRRPWFEALDRSFAIRRLVDGAFLSYETGLLKPDPRVFRHVLRHLQAKPQDLLLVDDRAQNVRAAVRMGMRAIQITAGSVGRRP